MSALEIRRHSVVPALHRTLDALEKDASDPRLGTRQFQSPEYTFVRATPAGDGDWYVLWTPEPDELDEVRIGR